MGNSFPTQEEGGSPPSPQLSDGYWDGDWEGDSDRDSDSDTESSSTSISPGTAAGDPRQDLEPLSKRQRRYKKWDSRLDRDEGDEDRNCMTWPALGHHCTQMLRGLLLPDAHCPALAMRSILSPKDAETGKWRGQYAKDTGRVDALSFLEHWGRTSKHKSEDLTESTLFLWGFYILQLTTDVDVIGPGIYKFFIAEISNVSNPDCRTHSLVEFIVWRSDMSQVRLQPRSSQSERVLFVDLPGPDYHGHLARELLPGNLLGPGAQTGVIATGKGLKTLFDTVTNAEAQAALEGLRLAPDTEVNLSDGIQFPWPLWIHDQPAIMEVVGPNTGVCKFSAIAFSFYQGQRGATCDSRKYIEADAFCMDLQNPAISLLMFPRPSDVFIMSFDPTRTSPSSCCANHSELQEFMFAEMYRPLPAPFHKVPWATGTRRSR